MQFSSIYPIYQEIASGKLSGFTVPAFNIRTLTFDVARALFRTAQKYKVGLFIIELAQSEIKYTNQTPAEYQEAILKAAETENYQGPIFLQADHVKCLGLPNPNIEEMEKKIQEAIDNEFYNIDIDCSRLPLEENIKQTNHFIDFIKNLNISTSGHINISIGGEIGQIGGENTTSQELEQFLSQVRGISKVAVQNGTAHGKGGEIDWPLLKELADKAKKYGVAGIVQHGASTLPDKLFKEFPKYGVCEIHLATELMDTILESKHFPNELKQKIQSKKDLGPLKNEISKIPQKNIDKIAKELEKQFKFFFKALRVDNTFDLVKIKEYGF